MVKKIFISAGHGGSDPGAVANGLVEKDLNIIVARKLRDLLVSAGFDVKMAREVDETVDLSVRTALANFWVADLYIAVHHNAGGGMGAEIIHSIYYGEGYNLAHFIGQEFEAAGQNLRKVYAREGTNGDYYHEIRKTTMPAIISEYAFLDSQDYKSVDTMDELYVEANALFKGICTFSGVVLPKLTSNISCTMDILVKEITIDKEYWIKNAVPGGQCDGELVATIFERFAKRIRKEG